MGIIVSHPDPIEGIARLYHLGYYFKASKGLDQYSRNILDFKDGKPGMIAAFSMLACSELNEVIHVDFLVRALGSGEILPREDAPLDRLGKSLLSEGVCHRYAPLCLQKIKATVPLKKMSRNERQETLKNLYRFILPDAPLSPKASLLIIDDVTTTGLTLREIARAIKMVIPDSEISAFALAKTIERDEGYEEHNWDVLELLDHPSSAGLKKRTPPKSRPSSTGKTYSVDDLRRTHKNAYKEWTTEEDHELLLLVEEGRLSTRKIAERFGRNSGAIRSRIKKLSNERPHFQLKKPKEPTLESKRTSGDYLHPESVSPKDKGGCFIATAVYGAYDHPRVRMLRSFRDSILLQSRTGRSLVAAYYRHSPRIANYLSRHRRLSSVIRGGLFDPAVKLLERFTK